MKGACVVKVLSGNGSLTWVTESIIDAHLSHRDGKLACSRGFYTETGLLLQPGDRRLTFFYIMMIWSLSGPTEMNLMGTLTSSSMRVQNAWAFGGRSSHVRASVVGLIHPSISS